MSFEISTRQRGSNRISRSTAKTASSTRNRPTGDVLQRTIGNSATSRLLTSNHIQAKLSVSNPRCSEREADRVANQVMRMTAANGLQKTGSEAQVLRKCTQRDKEDAQKPQDEERKLMRAAKGASPATVSPTVLPASGGQSLSTATRSFFEPRFGYDFSAVRIHTNARAHEAARSINAAAFTVGRDVVFGAGSYAPDSPAGRPLLAHELTHVQQNGGADNGDLKIGRQPNPMMQRQEACESLAPPNCSGGTCEEGRVCGGREGDWSVCTCWNPNPYKGGGGESGGGGSSDDW